MMLKIAALMALVVASTINYTNGCSSCPQSWMTLGNKCVKLFHESKLTFDEAESACNEYEVKDCDGTVLSTGHLVSIHSQQEQDTLVELVKTTLAAQVGTGWDPQVYIGMSVGNTNSEQTWTDGSNADFTSWFPGEPNNGPNSRGAIAAGGYSKGNWADVYSSGRFPYICELPCLEYKLI